MKLGLSLSGLNITIANLQKAGFAVEKNFSDELFESGKLLSDKAKEILQGKVDPMYSTGKLANSIGVNVLSKDNITVGPDMRTAPYAEWVEIGHFMVSGWSSKGDIKGARWWEGHHYMEGAWLEISPQINSKIANTLKLKLNDFGRVAGKTKHLTTGGTVDGWGGVD